MAVEIEVAVLLPEIWAASVAVLSQHLFSPDPALSCSVEWAGRAGVLLLGEEPLCAPVGTDTGHCRPTQVTVQNPWSVSA